MKLVKTDDWKTSLTRFNFRRSLISFCHRKSGKFSADINRKEEEDEKKTKWNQQNVTQGQGHEDYTPTAARDRKPDKPRQCGENQYNNFKSISALALRFSALRKDYGIWEIELSYES